MIPDSKIIKKTLRSDRAGFTLVELLLSMSMVSVLLIAIVTMSMHMGSIFTRGATLRELNVASRTINSDFSRSFNSVSAIDWQESVNSPAAGRNYISNDRGGAYCTGSYSYLWNTAQTLNDNSPSNNVPIRYAGTPQGDKSIRLIKIADSARAYCSTPARWTSVPQDGQATEILSSGETGLMIYDIRFSSSQAMLDEASNQRILNITYVLGTQSSDGLIDIANMSCAPPADAGGMEDYCAINKFELTVRTLGRQ